MRQLTESERIARDVAKSSRDVPYLADDLEHYIFDMGFTTALDHSADQITAYILSLEGLTAERDGLREQLFKATKDLKRMARDWREVAAGDYCQTYNRGMGQGLEGAADGLEDYINDKIQGEEK